LVNEVVPKEVRREDTAFGRGHAQQAQRKWISTEIIPLKLQEERKRGKKKGEEIEGSGG
jgi:hypothetical protein